MVMPPPWPLGAEPDTIRKPCRVMVPAGMFWIITGVRPGLPGITVTAGPDTDRTVIRLPMMVMFSRYVPGETETVSPLCAAAMAALMVRYLLGTDSVAAPAGPAGAITDSSAPPRTAADVAAITRLIRFPALGGC